MFNKVVVTGGLGFIGSELVKQLKNVSKKIVIVDNNSKHCTQNLSEVPSDVEVVNIDLTKDSDELDAVFAGSDIVYGLAAAIGGIKYFHTYPATILRNNNLILTNTLDRLVKHQCRFVYISSSMVMESATVFPTKESDLDIIPKPLSAYGFSKLSGEEYCKAYRQEFGLEYVICRPFNAYGVNEYPAEVGMAHVIPDIIAKVHKGFGTEENPLEVFGDGEQIRCYTHVSDIASGVIKASGHVYEDFNISVAKPHSVNEVVNLIWNKMRKEPLHVKYVEPFVYDVQKRIPDVSKAKELLGWQASVTLEDKIDEVIDWVCGVLGD